MWSYMITDAIGGRVLHRGVPLTEVKFDVSLTEGGSLTAKIPTYTFGTSTQTVWTDLPGPELDTAILDDAILNPATASRVKTGQRPIITPDAYDPLRRVVWVCWNNIPFMPYTITTVQPADALATTVAITGKRSDVELMENILIRDDIQFAAQDQFHIFKDLFDYGRGQSTSWSTATVAGSPYAAGQGSWLSVGWQDLSGYYRNRYITPGNNDDGYPGASRKIVETCLRQLMNLEGGFERRLACSLDSAGAPVAVVELGYPRVGYTAPKVTLEYPSETVMSCLRGKDASGFVTRADVSGQETNGSRPIGSALDRSALNAGYPLRERVWSESDVSDINVLNSKARGRLVGKVPTTWQVTLNATGRPEWGSYRLGDHVQLKVRTIPVEDHTLRIVGLEVAVENDGRATVRPVLQSGDEVDVE